jgi:hypothetical protein
MPLNINLSSDRFSMFNKERDISPIRHLWSAVCKISAFAW